MTPANAASRCFLPLCALFVIAGCVTEVRHVPRTALDPPATMPSGDALPGKRLIPQPPATTLLTFGELPLLYQFGAGGPVRLFDTTERTSIWSATVQPDSIILVDAGGVLVRGERTFTAQLDPQHRYELWYEPPPQR